MSDVQEGRRRSILREITAEDIDGLDIVARLHLELLDFGPMSALGTRPVFGVAWAADSAEAALPQPRPARELKQEAAELVT